MAVYKREPQLYQFRVNTSVLWYTLLTLKRDNDFIRMKGVCCTV